MKTIKDYMSILFILLFVIMGISLYFTIDSNNKKDSEIDRLKNNQEVLFNKLKFVESEKSVSVQSLEMTKKEFAEFAKSKNDEIKRLNIRIKDLLTYSNSVIETNVIKEIPIYDTVIVGDTVSCFNFNDNYATIIGCKNNSTNRIDIDFGVRDTITTVAYRVPHQF